MKTLTTHIYPPTVEERVAYGVALLDEHVPGWRNVVDADTLDVAKEDSCVLGQIFGAFKKGASMLYDKDHYKASGHGFDISTLYEDDESPEADKLCAAEFAALTDEWRSYLTEERR